MKRIVSFLLILTLGVSFIPTTALSEGEEAAFLPVGEEEILAEVVDEMLDETDVEIVPDEPASEENVSEEYFCGALPDDYSVPSYHSPYRLLLSASAALPEKYDARDLRLVTSVKDQGSYGTCWAFSLMAIAESNILKKYDVLTDLAEMQLVWFYYNGARNAQGEYNDPLGNFCGDHGYIKPGYTFYNLLSLGGNLGAGVTTQASWIGVTPEDELTAYNTAAISNIAQNGLPYFYAFEKDSFHLKNVRIANIETDIDLVKQMILEYGAVAVSYLQSNIYMKGNAYYHPTGSGGSGHAVTVIGWDDNFPAESFSENYRPQRNGAWLIKNSWGESSGDGGYFWMSYETKHGSGRSNAYAVEYEPSGTHDYCYQYDGGFYSKALTSAGKYIYTANVYTAQHDELVSAVSFWCTRQANVPYVVYIVSEPEEDRPMKGKILCSIEGMTAQPGYYSWTLPEPIFVEEGEKFSVVVRYENTTGGSFSFELDGDYTAGNEYGCVSAALAGQSYSISVNSQITERTTNIWKDRSAEGNNNRIKAFTVVPDKKTLTENGITLSYGSVTYDGTEHKPKVQVTYYGRLLNENVDYTVSYTENVNAGIAGVIVTGQGEYHGSVTKGFTIEKAEQKVSAQFPLEWLKIGAGSEITVSGAVGACTFSSSEPTIARVENTGKVYAVKAGKTTLGVSVAKTENYNGTSFSFPLLVVVPGDVTGDDDVTIADVVRLNQTVLHNVTLSEMEAQLGDVTQDGDVTMADVVQVNRFILGRIESL